MGRLTGIIGCAFLALCATSANATTIQDLVRIKGLERNTLTGLGIVIGLNGTGDESKDSFVAARPYSQLLKNLNDPVATLEELEDADAYAIVNVTLEVPATGAREGDRFDVHVETLFNASSLAGGRLFVSLLYPPVPVQLRGDPLAMAGGSVIIESDNPRSGIVRDGGQILNDQIFRFNPITPSGRMELIIKDQYAGYPVAATLANAINDEFAFDGFVEIAEVLSATTIRIKVPNVDRAQPAQFIKAVMTVPIDPSLIQTPARIVINEKQGIITFTGNVEIGPVGITHKGLSITSITPEPVPGPNSPLVQTRQWAGLDTTGQRGRNATRLQNLLNAFDQLRVPVADQIAIIHELKKTGALHAEIILE